MGEELYTLVQSKLTLNGEFDIRSARNDNAQVAITVHHDETKAEKLRQRILDLIGQEHQGKVKILDLRCLFNEVIVKATGTTAQYKFIDRLTS